MPLTIEGIVENNPSFADTIERLYNAREALRGSGETTPNGEQVGETMELVLMPWKEMRDAVANRQFKKWVWQLRQKQGVDVEDFFNDSLIEASETGQLMYRTPSSNIVSAHEYLDDKIQEQGDWGIMLAQTSDEAGTERLKGQSPDDLTNQGSRDLEIAGHPVDAMGIFEWIALTLQEDPRKLSSQDYSWLLANRLEVEGEARVPFGHFRGGRVWSGLLWAVRAGAAARPRLAVM